MALADEIIKIAGSVKGELEEKKGVHTLKATVAERKAFLSKKKLVYTAQFRIDDAKKELRFTENLKETGFGLSTGESDISPGFGFKKETYKTGFGPREGSIEEQSKLFGKDYSYQFDYSSVRKEIEKASAANGYRFQYQLTSIGL